MNRIEEKIKRETDNSPDVTFRHLKYHDNEILIIYDEPLVETLTISDVIIKNMERCIDAQIKKEQETSKVKIIKRDDKKNSSKNFIKLAQSIKERLSYSKVSEIKEGDIFYYLFSGFVLIVIDKDILALEAKSTSLVRGIGKPETESSLKGPKDAFVENFSQNIGLIRKRIKSENLILAENVVGRRSKSKVGTMYIKDIANKQLVDYIDKKIKEIDIDAILDSNELKEVIISGGDSTIFPAIISTERPDSVSQYLLQGRVAVIVENSPYVLIFPAFIADFFKSMDDYYQKSNNIAFVRIIRYIAFFITLLTPALYIALTTFNQEAIPTDLLLSFAIQRDGVPAPAFIEAILMIVAFEILREGDFRAPTLAGSTLSIVGALILGDAAVSAGLVSPIMIIVIALTTISGLVFSDINLINALRYWRMVLLLFASIGGLIGVLSACIIFVIKVCSVEFDGYDYTYPYAPTDTEQLMGDTINRKNITQMNHRPSILTTNTTRYRKRGAPSET